MPASQRAAPSEAFISNTAIVTPDAQKIPHITTPTKVEPAPELQAAAPSPTEPTGNRWAALVKE